MYGLVCRGGFLAVKHTRKNLGGEETKTNENDECARTSSKKKEEKKKGKLLINPKAAKPGDTLERGHVSFKITWLY